MSKRELIARELDHMPEQDLDKLLEFLRSLTDRQLLHNPKLSNPWTAPPAQALTSQARFRLRGEVAQVFPEDGSIALYHERIPGLMGAMKAPNAMEYLVEDRAELTDLKPGELVTASVRRQGQDLILSGLKPLRKSARTE